jgi:hypothetical protein
MLKQSLLTNPATTDTSPARPEAAKTASLPKGCAFPHASFSRRSALQRDPVASPLGGAHRLGAPYSSHRAPQRYASGLHSLRPCLGQGASRRARVGRVRSLNCLSILWNGSPVVLHMWTTEVLLCQNSLQYPVNNTRAHRRMLDRRMVIIASPRRVSI